MNICIWYETVDNGAGANSFLKALMTELCRLGHSVVFAPDASVDVVLVNSWAKGPGKRLVPREVERIKRFGVSSLPTWLLCVLSAIRPKGRRPVPIVHRLDGVASLYGRTDDSDAIQFAINRWTDCAIFQSEYCRDSFKQFSVVPPRSRIIHNGVDGDIYFPVLDRPAPGYPLRIIAASWSDNPMKGFSVLANLSRLAEVEVSFVGNWCRSVDPCEVRIMGLKTAEELAALMRAADVFAHAAENDPCPNVVMEALASGLPVLYRDSGGTTELACQYGVALSEDLAESVELMMNDYAHLREKIFMDRDKFLIAHAAQEYVKVFGELTA